MKRIDVAAVIDNRSLGWFQIRIIVLCFLVQFLDGFDTQAVAYVAPALGRAWHLGRGALGPVMGAGIVGILLGSLLIGPLADRFGRKKMMLYALFVMALFCLMTARSATFTELLAFRFLTGLGLGGVIPSTVVMANEFAPQRRRATMVTLMGCGYAVGAASGGLLSASLLSFGWPSVFYVGAVSPLLLAFALMVWLPESLRLLVLRGGERAGIAKILRKIDPQLVIDGDTEFTVPVPKGSGASVIQLFQERRAAVTLLLWLTFFMNLVTMNFLNNWLPTLVNVRGIPLEQALRIGTFLQFGGVIGVICLGMLCDRFGFYKVLAATLVLGAILSSQIASVGKSATAISFIIFATGFCVAGTQTTLSALAATLYPTEIRTTGTGWASGIGRTGGFAGPVVGGMLLGRQWPLPEIFHFAAIPGLCGCGFMVLMFWIQRKGKREEQQAPGRFSAAF